MSTNQPLSDQMKANCDGALEKYKAAEESLKKLADDPKASEKQIREIRKKRDGNLVFLRANCPGYLDKPEKSVKRVRDSDVENV